MEFTFSKRAKTTTFALMGIGFLLMLVGIFTERDYLHAEAIGDSKVVATYHHDISDDASVTAVIEETKAALAAHNLTGEVTDKTEEFRAHMEEEGYEERGMMLTISNLARAESAEEEHGHGHGHEEEHSLSEEVAHWFHNGEVSLPSHHARFWSNLLVNGFFFFAIGLGALFFLALQYATEAAWGTLLKRIFEAVMAYLPIGIGVLIFVFAAGAAHLHHIYHWMDPRVYSEFLENGNPSPYYDAIIAGKSAYLNQPFFWIRTMVYFATYWVFMRAFRKRSLLEDQMGGTNIHFKNYRQGALFLVFFAVFSSTSSWDWIMSIDTHWFSTLFGWYVFSGMWVSAIIVFIVLTLYLKNKGYLPQVNENHLHDLGKWMFAISFLWSYLWFSQFMLIWYSDIPEEVTYFVERITHYKGIFFGMFFVNFVMPMVILMSRDAKRNNKFLIAIGTIIFIGHWVDVFVMVMPGTVHEHWSFGFLEIGMLMFFLGGFVFTVLRQLTKAPLTPVHHPYLEESVHHHV